MFSGTGDRNQQGASAVEMALLLPIFLLVLFGIIEYGRYFYLSSMSAAVVSDAARLASLQAGQATDTQITNLVVGELNNGPSGNPPGFSLSVTPRVTITPQNTRIPLQPVTVTLSYPYVPLILPRFAGLTVFPTQVQAGATMTVEP